MRHRGVLTVPLTLALCLFRVPWYRSSLQSTRKAAFPKTRHARVDRKFRIEEMNTLGRPEARLAFFSFFQLVNSTVETRGSAKTKATAFPSNQPNGLFLRFVPPRVSAVSDPFFSLDSLFVVECLRLESRRRNLLRSFLSLPPALFGLPREREAAPRLSPLPSPDSLFLLGFSFSLGPLGLPSP